MPNIVQYLNDIMAAVYGEQVRGAIHDAISEINNAVDASTSEALKTTVDALVSSSASMADDMYTYSSISGSSTENGYKLVGGAGLKTSNSSYKLVKYPVTAGNSIRIVVDDKFQFQSSATVPSSGSNNNLVGQVYGSCSGVIKVPTGATYVILSTLASSNIAAVYNAASDLDIIIGEQEVQNAVSNWLAEHPEVTVLDGSLTYKKLVNGTLGFVTPEMYDAKGDGVTDDTTAISQAFTSGLNVQFKNGATYNISGVLTITNPITINGNGATIKQTAIRTNAIVASGVSNITISDLCIVGYGNDYVGQGGQIAPYGIKISGTSESHVSNIVVRNCVIKYCTWCGIDVYRADNVIIEGNTVVGTGVQDLEYESNYQFGINFGYGTDIKVLGNTVSETAQGLYIGQKLKNAVVSNNVIKDIRGQHGCYATSGTNFEFSNNVLSNIAMEGIKMQLDVNAEENAKNGIIAFNVFSGIGSFAIHTVNLTSNGYVVENYAINDNVIDNSANGVYITSGKDVVVKNNTIVNSDYGIRFRYMSAGSLTLENNFIKNIQNNGIAQYSDDATAVKDLIIKNNVLKECGQVGTSTAYAVMMKLNNLSISGKFIVDGNYISDDNNLSYYAAIIYAQSTEGLVFINNRTKNKTVYLYQGVKEFNNNICEGGLTISQSSYSGRKTRVYTGTVSDLPANTSGYSNGDMFYFTDVITSGYAMAVLQDGAWAMLGKLDDYVIHPFIDTHSASSCTINSVSITSSGDELTISMSITVVTRGSETVIGNFKAKSSLLPSAKTTIYANNISVYLSTLGYLTISGGVVNTTYDFTVKLVSGVLQSS